jgi:glucan phosphoethanolaminetransferase (alkaline phosphatase superfamily)
MFASSRWLFLLAWICPTLCLVGGGLPPERIVAALIAAALSGTLIAGLPVGSFRVARVVAALVFPMVWLWLAYVSLDGMGPPAVDTIATASNTYAHETMTALRLGVTPKSIVFGLLSFGLLAASFWRGVPPASRYSGVLFAAPLVLCAALAWAPRIMATAPAFLPGRDDWQNFPYGSMADLLATLADGDAVRGTRAHRKPREAPVTDRIDSIMVLGETFRFTTLAELTKQGPAASYFIDRIARGRGVFLPKVCASADATAISVPMLLTGTAPERHGDAATAPSGLARLAAAGYETSWISNQGAYFFRDEQRHLTWMAKGYANQYDEALLPVAAAVLQRSGSSNKALLLHLLDSHAIYEERYPRIAEPDALNAEQLDQLRYRRANAHTLGILQRVAELVDGASGPAFAVYVSDHGENILADHNGVRYHGAARTTTEAGYVPAIVLWNDAFGRKYAPRERLAKLLAAPVLAHADVYRIWMSFSGLPADLSPTAEPRILGRTQRMDSTEAIPCAALSP